MSDKDESARRRERAEQDLWLERAEMNRRIHEIQEERGPIIPAAQPEPKQDNQEGS